MKTTQFWMAVGLALVVGLAGCSRPRSSIIHATSGPVPAATAAGPAKAATGVPDEYRLGPGDKLKVVVFGHQDVSGEFVIDGSGNIALPLVGQFKAGSLTVTEMQTSLQKTLNDKYIVDPRISIEVLNYRPFFILGEVSRPGSYPYVAGIDVTQAVALGGGYTRRARTSSVKITRDSGSGRNVFDALPSAPVLPGDTIEVERRLF